LLMKSTFINVVVIVHLKTLLSDIHMVCYHACFLHFYGLVISCYTVFLNTDARLENYTHIETFRDYIWRHSF